MCGIVGIVNWDDRKIAAPEIASGMMAALRHHIPDSEGLWGEGKPATLGQTRLGVVPFGGRVELGLCLSG
jgi:asparagine synthetase B (glutamine-hydrolysing)